ncbi:hypothetical protein [uncultured Pseudomonas sp.]|uniref:hypothetical protein n=1 Tax=uncultured Pseudomonas sp. TaxID=114707 RepID=UPI0025E3FCD1|nr:hypothetical protein [uncultured Pseudomonas sp.]
MTIKTLLRVWGAYVVLSWVTSLGLFYSGIGVGSDLHRWLPVIAGAEDFFTAQGQLDFLKKTAVIYEKDVVFLIAMLTYMIVVFRYSMGMVPSGFRKLKNYKDNYLGLFAIVLFGYVFYTCIMGPDPTQSMKGIYYNQVYRLSVFLGAFYYTLMLPMLVPLAAAAVAGFLEPVKRPDEL